MARRVSTAPLSGTVPIFSPVAGSKTANVPPLSASTHWPSMKFLSRLSVSLIIVLSQKVRPSCAAQGRHLDLYEDVGLYEFATPSGTCRTRQTIEPFDPDVVDQIDVAFGVT